MTNFQHIRQMTEEELAKWLNSFTQDETPWDVTLNDQYCRKCYADDSEETICGSGGHSCPYFPDSADGAPSSETVCRWWLDREAENSEPLPLPPAEQMAMAVQRVRQQEINDFWSKVGQTIRSTVENGNYATQIIAEMSESGLTKIIQDTITNAGYTCHVTERKQPGLFGEARTRYIIDMRWGTDGST